MAWVFGYEAVGARGKIRGDMTQGLISVSDAMAAAVERHRSGRFGEAEVMYRRILAVASDYADAHHLLGLALLQQDQSERAIEPITQAIRLAPNVTDFRLNLANAQHLAGRAAQALAALAASLALDPTRADSHAFRASLQAGLNDRGSALEGFRLALDLDPNNSSAHYNLGNTLQNLDRLDAAVASYRRAVSTATAEAPFRFDIWSNLGLALFKQGLLDEAVIANRQALSLRPGHAEVERTLLQWQNLAADAEPMAIRTARADWCRRAADGLAPKPTAFRHDRSLDRRLRIGYVAGPTMFASTHGQTILPMMEAHDHGAVEIVTYSDLPTDREDSYTRRYRQASDQWRNASGLGDAEFAARVSADSIDVLVDIVGHLGGPRFMAIARRPAPVQIAAFITATSGLAAVDWVLADPLLVPPAHEAHFTERILRVPLAYLYKPLFQVAASPKPPCLTTGRITFGSLNGLVKVTGAVVALWARVLAAVPGSRMIVKGHAFSGASARARFHDMFARHRVSADRVELRGWTEGFDQHLRTLDDID
ncbi:MAG: tetratricopeptide repeat protein, partial [Alphaproteobacteria bacterium]|nr:tetratricopeptide repeat protein [Alphaproteobacteria bacterium]